MRSRYVVLFIEPEYLSYTLVRTKSRAWNSDQRGQWILDSELRPGEKFALTTDRNQHRLESACGNVDIRLPGKGNSNSHGAKPVYLIITMMKKIRTSRLSIKKNLSLGSACLELGENADVSILGSRYQGRGFTD